MRFFLQRGDLGSKKWARYYAAQFDTDRQRGIGLLEIIIGLGIVGILMMFLSDSLKLAFRGSKSVTLRTELEAIRRTMLTRVSCANSFNASTCSTAGQLVALRDRTGAVIIGNTGAGTKFGDWTVRAECNASLDGVFLRAARLRSNGTLTSSAASDFIPDPTSNVTVTWSDPKSLLFPSGTFICPSSGNFNLANYRLGAPTTLTAPAALTSGTSTEEIGSFTYTAIGNRLEISSRVQLQARGTGRTAALRLLVMSGSTTIRQDATVHRVDGNTNCQVITIGSFDQSIIQVTPGTTYDVRYILVSSDTGSSNTNAPSGGGSTANCTSFPPMAAINTPIFVTLKDFE